MHFFVAKLLSIAVITYTYVYHLQNLRLANLLCTVSVNGWQSSVSVNGNAVHTRQISVDSNHQQKLLLETFLSDIAFTGQMPLLMPNCVNTLYVLNTDYY